MPGWDQKEIEFVSETRPPTLSRGEFGENKVTTQYV